MKTNHGKNFRLLNKKTVFIDKNVVIGDNVTIYEGCRIEGETIIGDNVVLMPNCYIKDSIIRNGVIVQYSHLDCCSVGDNCQIGPFARLRPKSIIKNNVKIGNFVEIKNSIVDENTKISHLAYVGDAEIGKNCNIGCGAIFVNYNGKIKQKTFVGDGCFIGSNCNIIAPCIIEKGSYVCAGTTITKDIKSNSFVIGRVREEIKENRATNYLD